MVEPLRRLPWGETVTIYTRTASGTSPDGNDTFVTGSTDYEGCPVWPSNSNAYLSSSENTDARDLVTDGVSVLLPYDADVSAIDYAVIYGEKWELVGNPARYKNPFTGWEAGKLIGLKRWTG